jgi:hypothetical protein
MRSSVPRILVALAIAMVVPSGVQAFTITNTGTQAGSPASDVYTVGITAADVGGSFDVAWSLADPALAATGTFSVVSFTSSSIVLGITLSNTTDLSVSGLDKAAILSLALGVTPNPTSKTLTSAGAVFDSLGKGSGPGQNYPGGFTGIDVCVYSAQNCAGGNVNDGLQAGASDSFVLRLRGNWANGITLAAFGIKFQTSDGSYQLAGRPGAPIPEPTAALVFGLGLLVASYGSRGRRA